MFLILNNVDLKKTNINFYDDVDIFQYTIDAVPSWNGLNPIPEIEQMASTKAGYYKNQTDDSVVLAFMEESSYVDIEYSSDESTSTFNVHITSELEGEEKGLSFTVYYFIDSLTKKPRAVLNYLQDKQYSLTHK